MKPEDQSAKHEQSEMGRRADALMTDPAMLKAFDGLRTHLLNALANVSMRDPEGLQMAQASVKVLDRVRLDLYEMIRVGQTADADIQRQMDENERERQRLENEAKGIYSRGMQRIRQLAGS